MLSQGESSPNTGEKEGARRERGRRERGAKEGGAEGRGGRKEKGQGRKEETQRGKSVGGSGKEGEADPKKEEEPVQWEGRDMSMPPTSTPANVHLGSLESIGLQELSFAALEWGPRPAGARINGFPHSPPTPHPGAGRPDPMSWGSPVLPLPLVWTCSPALSPHLGGGVGEQAAPLPIFPTAEGKIIFISKLPVPLCHVWAKAACRERAPSWAGVGAGE